ncbi:MAG: nitroreductase family protein [Kineosporiaceae bacterium]
MDFATVVRRRAMVRRFREERVADDVVDGIVATALRGPSAGFAQGTHLLVLRTPQDVERYWTATVPAAAAARGDAWLTGMRAAPVLLVLWADPQRYLERYGAADKAADALAVGRPGPDPTSWPVPWWDVDTGMAALLALLAATDAGLGACLFGVPAGGHGALREAFGAPEGLRPVAVVAVGHPASDAPVRRGGRRPRAEVVHEGRFGPADPPPTAPQ